MFVAYGSPEYQQAVQLRYRLFYEEHGIEMGAVLTAREQNAKHLVVLKPDSLIVLAYGQLYRKSDSQYQIFQMVVEPDYQGQGLGSVILEKLIEVATYEKGELLTLSARTVYVGFYEKFGFKTNGAVFPSSSTGVPHVKMVRQCICAS